MKAQTLSILALVAGAFAVPIVNVFVLHKYCFEQSNLS
jgi:hypothetical protein